MALSAPSSSSSPRLYSSAASGRLLLSGGSAGFPENTRRVSASRHGVVGFLFLAFSSAFSFILPFAAPRIDFLFFNIFW